MNLLKEYGIKEDSRFKTAFREAKILALLWLVNSVWIHAWAIWGNSQDPSSYSYILGFPTWYFWAFLGIEIAVPVFGMWFGGKKIKDCSLDPYGKFDDENQL